MTNEELTQIARSSAYDALREGQIKPNTENNHHMSTPDLHPDAKALADHLCGYASACVADAVIEYLSRIDCSPDGRDMIRGGSFQMEKTTRRTTDPRMAECAIVKTHHAVGIMNYENKKQETASSRMG